MSATNQRLRGMATPCSSHEWIFPNRLSSPDDTFLCVKIEYVAETQDYSSLYRPRVNGALSRLETLKMDDVEVCGVSRPVPKPKPVTFVCAERSFLIERRSQILEAFNKNVC